MLEWSCGCDISMGAEVVYRDNAPTDECPQSSEIVQLLFLRLRKESERIAFLARTTVAAKLSQLLRLYYRIFPLLSVAGHCGWITVSWVTSATRLVCGRVLLAQRPTPIISTQTLRTSIRQTTTIVSTVSPSAEGGPCGADLWINLGYYGVTGFLLGTNISVTGV